MPLVDLRASYGIWLCEFKSLGPMLVILGGGQNPDRGWQVRRCIVEPAVGNQKPHHTVHEPCPVRAITGMDYKDIMDVDNWIEDQLREYIGKTCIETRLHVAVSREI